MSKKFDELSVDDQYAILKKSVTTIHERDIYKDDANCAFLEDGKVNIIGVRGFDGSVSNDNAFNEFNDTLFIAFKKDGKCEVHPFKASTDYGKDSKDNAESTLIVGQHKYYIFWHKKQRAYRSINNAAYAKSKYRALNPHPTVRTQWDKNHNQTIDANETAIKNEGVINIHYGGGREKVGLNSRGCQIIHGWENYKDFFRLLEADHSIKGTINNELLPKPATDGTRSVIYTLITGDELSENISEHLNGVGVGCFPTKLNDSLELTGSTVNDYYQLTEVDSPGGYFPVGANSLWHGGLHLRGDLGSNVHACMNGTIVAARLCEEPSDAMKSYGSRNFVLLKHKYKGKNLFSLYMHLSPITLDDSTLIDKKISWLPNDETIKYTVSDGNKINLWKNAGYSCLPENERIKIVVLAAGETIEYIETQQDTDGDDWYKVKKSDGTSGFIYHGNAKKRASKEIEKNVSPDVITKLKNGDVVPFESPISCGTKIWEMGENGSPGHRAPMLHWEIFSEENIFKDVDGFTEVIDADSNYNLDNATITKMFDAYNEGGWADDDRIEMDELIKFYKESEKRTELRNYCCKFMSEWGIPDIQKAIDALDEIWVLKPNKEDLEPYVWWQDAVSSKVEIPKSAHLWHYNPITIMKQCVDEPKPEIQEGTEEGRMPTDDESNIHTDWTEGYNRDITDQNKYNEYIEEYAEENSINKFIYKSLIAQESSFKEDAHNNMGFAGLTQIGGAAIAEASLNIGTTKKTNGKYAFDMDNDERFDPEKSIEGGAIVFKNKINYIDKKVFANYTTQPSADEKMKFYLAAYNGGQGTVKKAYVNTKKTDATWNDIIAGKEKSALWFAINENWGRKAKYKEITEYVHNIMLRASQSGTSVVEAPENVEEPQDAPVENVTSLKNGDFDDLAVEKYNSRKEDADGHIPGFPVRDLQQDLTNIGITDIGTVDGDYGDATVKAVKLFQEAALKKTRILGESDTEATITFTGEATGEATEQTLTEIDLWEEKTYKIPVAIPKEISDSVGVGGTNTSGDVKLVQTRLKELGYEVESCTGEIDDSTNKAIKMYQITTIDVSAKVSSFSKIWIPDGLISKGGNTEKKLFADDAKKYVAPTKGAVKPLQSDVTTKKSNATGDAKIYWDRIESVWNTVSPYLPAGSKMTSGFRSPADQRAILHNWYNSKYKAKIIAKYNQAEWQKYKDMQGSNDAVADPKMCSMVKGATKQLIAVPGRSAHQRGKALDVGGQADVEQAKTLLWCHVNFESDGVVTKILPERNGCMHIEFE